MFNVMTWLALGQGEVVPAALAPESFIGRRKQWLILPSQREQ